MLVPILAVIVAAAAGAGIRAVLTLNDLWHLVPRSNRDLVWE